MAVIRLGRFLGIAPKLAAALLAPAQGQTAKDAKLWSEQLRSFRGAVMGAPLTKTGYIQTIYWFKGDTWLHWTQDVNVVRGPIANDALEKTYFTGTDKPRVTTNTLWDDGSPGTFVPPASYILGIPAPVGPPVATDAAAGNVTVTNATWVYTFVRKWPDGTVDESAPSPVSNALTLVTRQASVTVPNGAIVSADYGITHKRLYRAETGSYKFVTEVTIGTSPATDNVATANLGEAIQTTNYLPPPDGMIGLIALPNGLTAGFKDNVVYISEPYRPHTYPLLNQYTVNFPIVALGNVGTQIVAMTTANPFVGSGVDPAAYTFARYPGRYPCVSKRSAASGEIGVIWATPNGLALSDGSQVQLITKPFITRDEWVRDFVPTTLHGLFHEGHYWAWFETGVDAFGNKLGGGLVFDPGERAFLTTQGSYVYAAFAIPETDIMHFVQRDPALVNRTFQHDADATSPLQYEWKSKVFLSRPVENFAFGKVIADFSSGLSAAELASLNAQIAAVQAFNAAQASTDGPLNAAPLDVTMLDGDTTLLTAPSFAGLIIGSVSFRYWLDRQLIFTKTISTPDPFPLPAGIMGEEHEIALSGPIPITEAMIATSAEELAQ